MGCSVWAWHCRAPGITTGCRHNPGKKREVHLLAKFEQLCTWKNLCVGECGVNLGCLSVYICLWQRISLVLCVSVRCVGLWRPVGKTKSCVFILTVYLPIIGICKTPFLSGLWLIEDISFSLFNTINIYDGWILSLLYIFIGNYIFYFCSLVHPSM